MSESCPLNTGDHRIDDIPQFCYDHCGAAWDSAVRTTKPIVDYYGDKSACNHEKHDVSFSHDALMRPGEAATREYVIVNLCEGCDTELFEEVYTFKCLDNNPDT